MHNSWKYLLLVLLLIGSFGFAVYGVDISNLATNQIHGSVANTNAVSATNDPPKYSEAELQAAAQQVWHKLILFGVVGLIGGAVVVGFAVYGAYRKFGVRGVIVVGIVVALGVFALGGLLLLF